MDAQVPHCLCNDVFNHTSLYQYHQGKLLIHLTVPFKEKPKDKLPEGYLRYYRLRKSLTTKQVAEAIGSVPAMINQHPISHDTAVLLADILGIDVSLLFDEFATFIATPYANKLKRIRSEMNLNQREFAEINGITPNYYYKLEEGARRPSRKLYHQIMKSIKSANPQTSHSDNEPLQ